MRVHRSDRSFHLASYLPNERDQGSSCSESNGSSINSDEERRILDAAHLVGLPDAQSKHSSSRPNEPIGSTYEKEDTEPIGITSQFAVEEFEHSEESSSGHVEKQEEPKRQWKKMCWRIAAATVLFVLLNTAILLTKLHQGRTEQSQPTPAATQSVQQERPTVSVERSPSTFPTPFPPTIRPPKPTTEASTLEPTTIAPTLEPTLVIFVRPGGFGFGGGTNLPPVRENTFPPTTNPTAVGTGEIRPIPGASSTVAPTPSARKNPESIGNFGVGRGPSLPPTRNTQSLAPMTETNSFGLRREEKPSASGLTAPGPVLPTSTAAPSR